MQAQNTFPTTGNVGIGTTSPKSALEVNGDISLTRSNKIQFLDAVNGNNRAYIRSTNGENGDYNSPLWWWAQTDNVFGVIIIDDQFHITFVGVIF